MTIGGIVAALLAVSLGLAAVPTAAQAAPDPDLHIDSVTLNKTSVAVSGLNTIPVTVTVKGSYDANANTPVNVLLERTGGTGQQYQLVSTNLARNATTGTWSGPLNVPSTANGTFKVTGVMTDTNGVVTKAYPGDSWAPITCLLLPGNPTANGWLSFVPARPGIVSAAPSKSSAPVGTVVPVNGSVQGPPYSCPVHLQRLYGATQWRTVSSATVRQSGRFTVNAQPAYQGTIPYRVSFPRCRNYQAGVSKTFSIRGT